MLRWMVIAGGVLLVVAGLLMIAAVLAGRDVRRVVWRLHLPDGTSVGLCGGVHTVGVGPANDIVLSGTGIASIHATVHVDEQRVAVTPVGAAVVSVNGSAISSAGYLVAGDVIRLGDQVMALDRKGD